MKKLLILIAIILMSTSAFADTKGNRKPCCYLDADTTINGTLTMTGTAERITGTGGYVDFNDAGAGAVTYSGIMNVTSTAVGIGQVPDSGMFQIGKAGVLAVNLDTYHTSYFVNSAIRGRKSAHATLGEADVVAPNEELLELIGAGSDGVSAFRDSNAISFETEDDAVCSGADCAFSATSMPGKIVFLTTPEDTVTPVERARIHHTGGLQLAPQTVASAVGCAAGTAGTMIYVTFENFLCVCDGTSYKRADDTSACTDS